MAKRSAERMYGTFASVTTIENDVVYRTCVFCGANKPIVDFPKNGVGPDGAAEYRTDCKVCYNVRRKANKSRSRKHHSDFIGGMKRRGEDVSNYTLQEWKECLLFFGGECAYCGCTPRKNQRLTRDHLDPWSQGGRTTQSNIVPACSSCNSSKGATDFKVWFMAQPFFSQERLNRIFKWRTILRMVGGGDKSAHYSG